jgi:hypothetical protein
MRLRIHRLDGPRMLGPQPIGPGTADRRRTGIARRHDRRMIVVVIVRQRYLTAT